MNNILLRKGFRITLATLSTIVMIILIWVILDCFPRDVIIEEKPISYKAESTLKYIGNKDYKPVLRHYYYLKTDKVVDSIYKYRVTANLRLVEDGKTVINRKIKVTESRESETIDQDMIKIDTVVELPLDVFLYETFGIIDGIKNRIYIDFNLETDNYITLDKLEPEYIDVESTNKITVPLSEIEKNKEDKETKGKKVGIIHKERTKFNSYLFMLSFVCFFSVIPLTILSYASLFNLSNYDEYKRRLKAIKKKYGSFIVERKKVPSFKKKEIIEVELFKNILEHLDEEDIVFYDKNPGKESWFYIEKKKEVYLYILRLEHNLINMKDNTKIELPKKRKK
ncbi:MAG: hypothetical protein IKQ35_00160 [Bacilli bacterium]|nr:hypothetical protein [Bacilli bacterium]